MKWIVMLWHQKQGQLRWLSEILVMLMELRPTLGSPNSISHITWTRTGGIPLNKLLDNALYDLAESQVRKLVHMLQKVLKIYFYSSSRSSKS
jgi:hypothetical protein